jgi:sugar phosphate isomerase/epimerase
MLLGYNTNGFAHHRLEDAVSILSELGYKSIAITLDQHSLNPFEMDVLRPCERIRALLTTLNLTCVIETGARFLLDPRRKHQPTLLSSRTEDRRRRRDFLRRAVDLAAELRAGAVSFWSGTPDDPARTDLMDILVDECNAIADYAAPRVRLAFEPEPGMFIDTMAKFEELHRRVNHRSFGLTLDVGHLHCMGELAIAEHIHRWKDVLWNVHIEDMRRGVHDHLMFGEGEMDFPPILCALRDIGYQGGIHVELSRHSHDAVNTAKRAFAFLSELKT